MIVRCIQSMGNITQGDDYGVYSKRNGAYGIEDDLGYIQWYPENLFIVIEEDKDKVEEDATKELTIAEVLSIIKDKQVWQSKWKRIYINAKGDVEIVPRNEGDVSALTFPKCEKFTLKAEMVTFEEALKAYEQGIEILSCYKGCRFVKRNGKDYYKEVEDIDWNSWSVEKGGFTFEEIRNLWYINE